MMKHLTAFFKTKAGQYLLLFLVVLIIIMIFGKTIKVWFNNLFKKWGVPSRDVNSPDSDLDNSIIKLLHDFDMSMSPLFFATWDVENLKFISNLDKRRVYIVEKYYNRKAQYGTLKYQLNRVLNDAEMASIRWLDVSYLSDETKGYIETILEKMK